MLNRYQLRSAELLTNYVFILTPIPGMKNPADGLLYCLDYVQNISIPTSSLILVHAINPLESTTRE